MDAGPQNAGDNTTTPDVPAPFSSSTPTLIFLPTPDRGPNVQPTNTPFAFTDIGTAGSSTGIAFASGGQFVSGTGAPVVQGATAFDFGPGANQVAAYYPSQDAFYVNGIQLTTSPASEFGFGNKRVSRLKWSPSGALVAMVISGEDPANAADHGVWIYNVGSNTAVQIFRNDIDSLEAIDVQWSPNSGAVLVTLQSQNPFGIVHVILALNHDANDRSYPVHTYSQTTWAPDTGSVIASGRNTDGSIVFGRINLPNQNYTPITVSAPDVVFTYAGLEPVTGIIYFLGGPSENGPFRLYSVGSGGGAATVVSSATISGRFVQGAWNDGRNTLLVVLETPTGRRAYLLSASGTITDVTPAGGIVGEVRWQ